MDGNVGVAAGVALGQLCGDEDLFARQAALGHGLPHLPLVAVHRRGVDEPVADLERVAHRLDGAASTCRPGAEPEQRHPRPGGELDGAL